MPRRARPRLPLRVAAPRPARELEPQERVGGAPEALPRSLPVSNRSSLKEIVCVHRVASFMFTGVALEARDV